MWAAMLGSEEQKQKYLPSLARLDTIGCWVGSYDAIVTQEILLQIVIGIHELIDLPMSHSLLMLLV